ncbi:hypothetical protein JCM10212_002992 [Sporobolomyces blumeae]
MQRLPFRSDHASDATGESRRVTYAVRPPIALSKLPTNDNNAASDDGSSDRSTTTGISSSTTPDNASSALPTDDSFSAPDASSGATTDCRPSRTRTTRRKAISTLRKAIRTLRRATTTGLRLVTLLKGYGGDGSSYPSSQGYGDSYPSSYGDSYPSSQGFADSYAPQGNGGGGVAEEEGTLPRKARTHRRPTRSSSSGQTPDVNTLAGIIADSLGA